VRMQRRTPGGDKGDSEGRTGAKRASAIHKPHLLMGMLVMVSKLLKDIP